MIALIFESFFTFSHFYNLLVFFISTQTETFNNLVESEEDYDNKSLTAIGILETIQIIVGELDGSPEVCKRFSFLVSRHASF